MKEQFEIKIGNEPVKIEINDWAARASASVLIRLGKTVILTTVVLADERDIDFLPLSVDYEEKFYAAGKIYGSRFVRREGRPSQTAILNGRLIDRTIRPGLKNLRRDIQIINTVLSLDPAHSPEILALNASSLAVDLLGFEWGGPVAGVSLVKTGGSEIIFPSENLKKESDIWLVVAGRDKINMIEAEAAEAAEADIFSLCQKGEAEIKKISKSLREISDHFVKSRIKLASVEDLSEGGRKFLIDHGFALEKIITKQKEGELGLSSINEKLEAEKENLGADFNKIKKGVDQLIEEEFKKLVLEKSERIDGRQFDQVRKLEAEIDVLPNAHGSAIFKRGLTHILSVTTLAAPTEELFVQEIEFEGTKRFIHHYNFPPYSVGETGPLRGPGRREIGHGALVEKGLVRLLPGEEDFPYMIRVVSDSLSSNGSTSMASLCASSLSLFDAGVPLKNPIAGISIGLIYENDKKYQTLVDIQGPEDAYGDMDFKVIGTSSGVCAIQLDVKIDGLTLPIIEEALAKAKKAREEILAFMARAISQPRKEFKPGVPVVEVFQIDSSKIGLVIGAGGKTIQEISLKTNSKIDIESTGVVFVAAETKAEAEKAVTWIKNMTEDLKPGQIVEATVVKIMDFGAIVEITPKKTALLHISEMSDKRIKDANEAVKVGETLTLVIKSIADDGKIRVSLKDVRAKQEALRS